MPSANGCIGPYVTAVGGTTLTGAVTEDTEKAVTHIGSGGGFSNNFARPSYQDAAVEAYFESPQAPTYPFYTGSTYGDGYYNRTGRGCMRHKSALFVTLADLV